MRKEKAVGIPRIWRGGGGIVHACPGCQEPLVARIIAEVLEEMGVEGRAIAVFGIGCSSLIMMGRLDVDWICTPHGRCPDVATGLKRAHPEALVFTVQGDGDLFAIGAGSFIGALNRGERITVFLLNNANYGNTGGQMAPTTLLGQTTTTTPQGRDPELAGYPPNIAELAALFKGCAYSARGALNSPANYQRTKRYVRAAFKKQMEGAGLSFVEVLTACPPNWHLSPRESLRWVEERMIPEYPLGEFKS